MYKKVVLISIISLVTSMLSAQDLSTMDREVRQQLAPYLVDKDALSSLYRAPNFDTALQISKRLAYECGIYDSVGIHIRGEPSDNYTWYVAKAYLRGGVLIRIYEGDSINNSRYDNCLIYTNNLSLLEAFFSGTGKDYIVRNNDIERIEYHGTPLPNNNRIQIRGTEKLIALLLNPLAAGQLGSFTRGETVNIPRAFLRVIDLQQSGNIYSFLVMVNDNNISKPFYVNTNRMLNLMDISYPNTIFEELVIQYVGTENYLFNGVPRETFVFQLSQ